jgi:hypothetical protein
LQILFTAPGIIRAWPPPNSHPSSIKSYPVTLGQDKMVQEIGQATLVNKVFISSNLCKLTMHNASAKYKFVKPFYIIWYLWNAGSTADLPGYLLQKRRVKEHPMIWGEDSISNPGFVADALGDRPGPLASGAQ